VILCFLLPDHYERAIVGNLDIRPPLVTLRCGVHEELDDLALPATVPLDVVGVVALLGGLRDAVATNRWGRFWNRRLALLVYPSTARDKRKEQ
jgi:hypothetical protein